MELTKQYIENNVDKLMMTNKNGVSLLLNSNPLYLEPTVDSDYNVKFTSDDSIIQAGYELKQTEISKFLDKKWMFDWLHETLDSLSSRQRVYFIMIIIYYLFRL